MNKRLRQPYWGKIGRIGGKVRFGEPLEEAARRELFEETGLEAEVFILERIYHKIRFRKDDIAVQDVIFYQFFIKNPTGDFIEKTLHQENFWISKRVFEEGNNFDVFDDFWIEDRFEPELLSFEESRAKEKGF